MWIVEYRKAEDGEWVCFYYVLLLDVMPSLAQVHNVTRARAFWHIHPLIHDLPGRLGRQIVNKGLFTLPLGHPEHVIMSTLWQISSLICQVGVSQAVLCYGVVSG